MRRIQAYPFDMSSNQSPRSKIRRTLEKEKEELTVARRRRGSGSSGNHGEVLSAFPSGDGVHDGVPLEPAKTVMQSRCSSASCNEGEEQLEVRP
jgi:hypothetical protein